MAATTINSAPSNLATLLLIKRKMAAKNGNSTDMKQTAVSAQVKASSHSNERLPYRQVVPVSDTVKVPDSTVQTQTPIATRNNKQLEVELFDKKMQEIDQKKEIKTKEAINKWKGFDSLNYGFVGESERFRPKEQNPVPLAKPKPSTPAKSPKRNIPLTPKISEKPTTESSKPESPWDYQEKVATPPISESPTPERVDIPVPERSHFEVPLKEDENEYRNNSPIQEETEHNQSPIFSPPPQEPIEKQISPVPQQSPHREPSLLRKPSVEQEPAFSNRRESIEKQPSLPPPEHIEKPVSPSSPSILLSEKPMSPARKQIQQPVPTFETIVPISSAASNPELFRNKSPNIQQSAPATTERHRFRLFPETKSRNTGSQKAHQSIQRSMDRYRFHVW